MSIKEKLAFMVAMLKGINMEKKSVHFLSIGTPLYEGDHQVSDKHENSTAGPSAPSFPPVSSMDHVTGYENVDSEGGECLLLTDLP